ncbi:MAG: hypothetical protein AAF492_06100, partial [Verrucomicrobiota bacterium]
MPRRRYGGNASGGGADDDGAAARITNGDFVAAFCTFRNNTANDQGGAVRFTGGVNASPVFSNCVFQSNQARQGGAIYADNEVILLDTRMIGNRGLAEGGAAFIGGVNTTNPPVTIIQRSVFIDNRTEDNIDTVNNDQGGALWLRDGGFLVEDSHFTNNLAGREGGAIKFQNPDGVVTVRDCTFQGNEARVHRGGAIFIDVDGVRVSNRFVVVDSVFRENRSGQQGGAFNAESEIEDMIFAFTGCTFIANQSRLNEAGAIMIHGRNQGFGGLVVDDCLFEENESYRSGGAIKINGTTNLNSFGSILQNSRFIANRAFNPVNVDDDGGALQFDNGRLLVTGCLFSNNHAGAEGGAVNLYNNDTGETNAIRFVNTDFIANRSTGENGDQGGGAINADGGIVVSNCLFAKNSQENSGHGGAIHFQGPIEHSVIDNCTFADNRAAGDGGAIRVDAGTLSVSNSIFYGNRAFRPQTDEIHITAGDHLNLSFSLIDTAAILVNGTLATGLGLFSTDPRFADPLNGDYHLQSPFGRFEAGAFVYTDSILSPAVDAGDPAVSNLLETLPNGSRLNLGRYGNTLEASKSMGTHPVVVAEAVTMITTTSAVLNGSVVFTGAPPTGVRFLFGTTDAGTNLVAWDRNELVSTNAGPGPVSLLATGLTADTQYHVRLMATNASGDVLSEETRCFFTGEILIQSVQFGNETGPAPGVFEITRPAGMAGVDLTLNLTVSGTAIEGLDYQALPRSITMPAGVTVYTQLVKVIDDFVLDA